VSTMFLLSWPTRIIVKYMKLYMYMYMIIHNQSINQINQG